MALITFRDLMITSLPGQVLITAQVFQSEPHFPLPFISHKRATFDKDKVWIVQIFQPFQPLFQFSLPQKCV